MGAPQVEARPTAVPSPFSRLHASSTSQSQTIIDTDRRPVLSPPGGLTAAIAAGSVAPPVLSRTRASPLQNRAAAQRNLARRMGPVQRKAGKLPQAACLRLSTFCFLSMPRILSSGLEHPVPTYICVRRIYKSPFPLPPFGVMHGGGIVLAASSFL